MAQNDFQDIMIETGIDTLLKYLSKYGGGTVSEISNNIGVSEDRIKGWAKDLEDEGMIEINYSVRDGMKLTYTDDNVEEIKNQVKILDQQIEDNSTKLKKAVQKRKEKMKETKKQLQIVVDQFDNLQKEERKIESQIEQIEDLEQTIEDEIGYEGKVTQEEVHKINQINEIINDIPTDEISEIEYNKTEIETSLKAKKKLDLVLEHLDEPVNIT